MLKIKYFALEYMVIKNFKVNMMESYIRLYPIYKKIKKKQYPKGRK